MMKRLEKTVSALLVLGALFCLAACSGQSGNPTGESIEPAVTDSTAPVTLATSTTVITTTTVPAAPPDISVNMLAVGDNLVQTYVYKAAQARATGGEEYNFVPLYENVKPIIEAADVAVINQETIICGPGFDVSGSNYNFCSPPVLADTMIEMGFDIFTLANNHLMDRGIEGLEASISFWNDMMRKNPVLALGAYSGPTDQDTIRVQDIKGMRIAYLSYTQSLNGYYIPNHSTLCVGMTSETELIERQIKRAKEVADVVVVSAHWGNEDTHVVAPGVKELAQSMVNWGADVILGTHSHTAQTMEYLVREDGTQGFVFYSLGNFISAQTDNFNVVGEMANFNIVQNGETGAITIEDIGVMPVITHYDANFANLRLYPYNAYTEELANAHALPYTHAPGESAKDFGMHVINAIADANIPKEYQWLS